MPLDPDNSYVTLIDGQSDRRIFLVSDFKNIAREDDKVVRLQLSFLNAAEDIQADISFPQQQILLTGLMPKQPVSLSNRKNQAIPADWAGRIVLPLAKSENAFCVSIDETRQSFCVNLPTKAGEDFS
jgi:hypothetical protein